MAFIKNLNYKIDRFNLEIPFLEIKDKEINLIMGPSGSGKTTLFNLITGYISYTNWSFEVDGVDISKLDIGERQLGVVFQSYELFPHLTAAENIEIVMQARNNSKAQGDLENFKNLLNLKNCWDTKASHLSGGEKQRVSILRAILSKPRMLLLDEPFSALDENNKEEARSILKQVLSLSQITTLMISHDPNDLKIFDKNVIRLEKGKLSPFETNSTK